MTILNRLQNAINLQLANIGIKNSVLESIGKSKNYRLMTEHFKTGLQNQIFAVLDDELLETIKSSIGKDQTHIWTESDSLEVQDAVAKKIKKHPLSDFISSLLVGGYLLYVFNKGGQALLDKENIPKDFELTDPTITTSVTESPATIFKGLDETTSDWISNQIIAGKSGTAMSVDGKPVVMTNSQIVDSITDKVPDLATYRAATIVRTESAKTYAQAEHITAVKNGASHKKWQTCDDDRVSDECMANEDEGTIGVEESFVSGASIPPQHPNCRCVIEYQFTPFMGSVWSGQ